MRKEWSDVELEILKKFYHLGAKVVQLKLKEKGFDRTITAIKSKANRLKLESRVMGRGRVWTKEEENFLLEHWDMSIDDLARILNRPREAIISKRSRLNQELGINKDFGYLSSLLSSEEGKIILDTVKLETLVELQDAIKSRRQTEAYREIEVSHPIGVVFLGDLHIGSSYVDYKRLYEDLELIKKIENIYVCFMGDYCQFSKGIRKAVVEDLIPSQNQWRMMIDTFEKIKEKILCVILGTHESFVLRDSGLDLLEGWCFMNKIPYFRYGGKLHLKVGDILYDLLLRHEYRFESELNITNALRRMLEILGDADIIGLAHVHRATIHSLEVRGRPRVLLRTGTYKVLDDLYADRRGWKVDSQVYMPLVVFYPDKKLFIPFIDFRQGLPFLEFEIKKYERINKDGKQDGSGESK